MDPTATLPGREQDPEGGAAVTGERPDNGENAVRTAGDFSAAQSKAIEARSTQEHQQDNEPVQTQHDNVMPTSHDDLITININDIDPTHDGTDIVARAAAVIVSDDSENGDQQGRAGLWHPDSPSRRDEKILDIIHSVHRELAAVGGHDCPMDVALLESKCTSQGYLREHFFQAVNNATKDGTLIINLDLTVVTMPPPIVGPSTGTTVAQRLADNDPTPGTNLRRELPSGPSLECELQYGPLQECELQYGPLEKNDCNNNNPNNLSLDPRPTNSASTDVSSPTEQSLTSSGQSDRESAPQASTGITMLLPNLGREGTPCPPATLVPPAAPESGVEPDQTPWEHLRHPERYSPRTRTWLESTARDLRVMVRKMNPQAGQRREDILDRVLRVRETEEDIVRAETSQVMEDHEVRERIGRRRAELALTLSLIHI